MALVRAPEAGQPPSQPVTPPVTPLPFSFLWWPGSYSLVARTLVPHDMVFTSVDLIKISPITQALVGGGSGPGPCVCLPSVPHRSPCAEWGRAHVSSHLVSGEGYVVGWRICGQAGGIPRCMLHPKLGQNISYNQTGYHSELGGLRLPLG